MDPARPDPFAYVAERLDWYHRKAGTSRAAFLSGRGIELAAAVTIPILALSETPPLVIAGLGALIAIVAGLEQLFRFQESWINYRQTSESLRSELFLYRAGAGPYEEIGAGTTPERVLANRVAGILSQENTRWQAIAKRARVGDQPGETLRAGQAVP